MGCGTMEREFGKELVRAFGARMKRLYELEDDRLPSPIRERLAELQRVERYRSCASESGDEGGCSEHAK